jgi:hypothetical protein
MMHHVPKSLQILNGQAPETTMHALDVSFVIEATSILGLRCKYEQGIRLDTMPTSLGLFTTMQNRIDVTVKRIEMHTGQPILTTLHPCLRNETRMFI